MCLPLGNDIAVINDTSLLAMKSSSLYSSNGCSCIHLFGFYSRTPILAPECVIVLKSSNHPVIGSVAVGIVGAMGGVCGSGLLCCHSYMPSCLSVCLTVCV